MHPHEVPKNIRGVMLTQRGIITSKGTMGAILPPQPATDEILLGLIAAGLRSLRARIEDGGTTWTKAVVATRYPFVGWPDDADPDHAIESEAWVGWVKSPRELVLADETGWLIERQKPTRVERKGERELVVRLGSVEHHPSAKTPDPVGAFIAANGLVDSAERIAFVPFAPVAATLPSWFGSLGPPGRRRPSPISSYGEQRPALRFDHGGFSGWVFVGLTPLAFLGGDPGEQRPEWSVSVGLHFDAETPDGAGPEGLWDHLDGVLAERGWSRAELVDAPPVAEPPPPTALRRFIEQRPAVIDRETAYVLDCLRENQLPVDGSAMRPWSDLVAAEVARLQKDEGENAFHKIPRVRDALLVEKTKKGETVVELTAEGAQALRSREGRLGFRERHGDGERLVKVLPSGVEVTLSWNQLATTLSADHRRKVVDQLTREEHEAEGCLYQDEKERSQRRQRIEAIKSYADAQRIFHNVVTRHDPKLGSTVAIPLWELKALLDIPDDDPDALQRIKSASSLLLGLRWSIRSGDGFVESVAVSRFIYDGAPRGKDMRSRRGNPHLRADALFFYDIREGSIQALGAYFSGNAPKGASPRWIETTTLASHVEGAAGFTARQSRLWQHLRAQLTRRRDASRFYPVIPNDSTPRSYDSRFCPLLPAGREFSGALGRFAVKRRPESGFTLQHLVRQMGVVPHGAKQRSKAVEEALADIDRVVVKTFGGVVAARTSGGTWVKLDEVRRWEWVIAEKVALFIFLPPDIAGREKEVVEDHHRRRKERGETDLDVLVADPEVAAAENPPSDRDAAFREEVRLIRNHLGMTQARLALELGVDRTQLLRWEQGTRLLKDDAKARLVEWVRRHRTTPPSTPVFEAGRGKM